MVGRLHVILATLRANGEIQGIPPARLDAILRKAEDELEGVRSNTPPGPPGPPGLLPGPL